MSRAVRLAAALAVACGARPSPECEKYLTCAEAAAPNSTRSQVLTYGTSGTCWSNAGDAEACTALCKLALDAVRSDAGRVTPECQ
ncbi:MAG: hypothetical protein JNK82_08175 [Myxococcaceae bacterium]|nr:hypothetical protein [Myxococcaceae bacterium]